MAAPLNPKGLTAGAPNTYPTLSIAMAASLNPKGLTGNAPIIKRVPNPEHIYGRPADPKGADWGRTNH